MLKQWLKNNLELLLPGFLGSVHFDGPAIWNRSRILVRRNLMLMRTFSPFSQIVKLIHDRIHLIQCCLNLTSCHLNPLLKLNWLISSLDFSIFFQIDPNSIDTKIQLQLLRFNKLKVGYGFTIIRDRKHSFRHMIWHIDYITYDIDI